MNMDPNEVDLGDTPHKYASPEKIRAMSDALYKTLRKKKKKKPPQEVCPHSHYEYIHKGLLSIVISVEDLKRFSRIRSISVLHGICLQFHLFARDLPVCAHISESKPTVYQTRQSSFYLRVVLHSFLLSGKMCPEMGCKYMIFLVHLYCHT